VPGLGNWSDHRYYFDRELRWEASTVRLGQTMTVRFVALVQIEELFGAPPELGALRAHGFTVTETADGFFVEPVPTAFGMASVTSRKDRWSGGVRCYAAGQCAAARAWLVARKLDPHTTGDQVSFDVDR